MSGNIGANPHHLLKTQGANFYHMEISVDNLKNHKVMTHLLYMPDKEN